VLKNSIKLMNYKNDKTSFTKQTLAEAKKHGLDFHINKVDDAEIGVIKHKGEVIFSFLNDDGLESSDYRFACMLDHVVKSTKNGAKESDKQLMDVGVWMTAAGKVLAQNKIKGK
jgi:hypothetical protein